MIRTHLIAFAAILPLLGMIGAALNSANTKFAAEDLRNQETRLAYAGGRP